MIRNTPQHDLLNELHNFVQGALKFQRCNPVDLTKTALRLLKNLPTARTALFEYFSSVFAEAALNYIQTVEKEIKTGSAVNLPESDEVVVSEIHGVLLGFIADNPTAWAPIVSTWSLDLLGEISTKFAGRAHISTNLSKTLQLWMNCRATKALVNINTKCLSSLMHSDTETCINALLDTSVKHSPNFDWVVAHVGSRFPNTVITRVLSCGLKDFCQIRSYELGSNSPKLRSVVGILGHLAESHSSDIRSAILELFFWSIVHDSQDTDVIKLQKKATVPFILQLSFLSDTLFSSICKDLKHTLTVDTVGKLYAFTDDWIKYFGTTEILEDLLLTLILSCNSGASQIINLLLDCALSSDINRDISDKSLEILQNILYRIDESIRARKKTEFIDSCSKELKEVHVNLLDSNEIRSQTAAQIIIFGGHANPSLLVQSITHFFQNAKTPEHLSLLVKILTHQLLDQTQWPYCDKGGYFSVVLEEVFNKNFHHNLPDSEQIWTNLLTLLKWEMSGRVSLLNSRIIYRAIRANLLNLTDLFISEKLHVHVISEIIDLALTDANISDPIEINLKLTLACVNYFFICCSDVITATSSKKSGGFERINRMLKRLCTSSKVAKVLALRELLERALFRSDDNILFGFKNVDFHTDNSNKLLLKHNKKINKTIPLTKHSSVFNGGIIGSGKRKIIPPTAYHPDVISGNVQELINVLKSCCFLPQSSDGEVDKIANKFSEICLESVTLTSLLLVQFVSPDVMYNGLPWPDEEFAKVTIERDLFIHQLFATTPLLWDLLNFVAVHRPSLCYCSVLLRALVATLIHQWKSTGEQSSFQDTTTYKMLMDTTVRVIDVMALGQLLPPPLCSVREVLPHLKCFEIVAILKECIWCYMRDHIPAPALFTRDSNGIHWRDPTLSRPSEVYTNTLRIIMQRNIDSLGHMYAQMFINIPKHD